MKNHGFPASCDRGKLTPIRFGRFTAFKAGACGLLLALLQKLGSEATSRPRWQTQWQKTEKERKESRGAGE